MRNFLALLKVQLIQNLNIRQILKLKSNKKGLALLLGILLFGFIFAIFFSMILGMGYVLNEVGEIDQLFVLALIAGMMITLMSILAKSNEYLFKGKDHDMLFSMPIKSNTIFSAKLIVLLILSYLTYALLYIPVIIVYVLFQSVSVMYFISAILVFFLSPLLFVVLGAFLSYLLGVLFANFKYKNLFAIVGYMVMLIAIFYVNFTLNSPESIESTFDVLNNIIKYIPPLLWANRALLDMPINLIYLILVNGIALVIFILIVSRRYQQIILRLNKEKKTTAFKVDEINETHVSVTKILLKREFKKYFSFPAYVINSLASPIVSVFLVVMFYFQLDGMGDVLSHDIFVMISACLVVFFGGFSPTTSVSLSLEGKEFWILKSAPVSPFVIFKTKVLLNFILVSIASVIISILMFILLQTSIISTLLLLVLFLVSTLYMSIVGIIANLILPKMKFDQPIKVVKQSMSLLLTMGIAFVSGIIVVVPVIFAYVGLGSLDLSIFLAIVIYSILLLIAYVVLKKIGLNLYNRLEA